MPVRAVLVPVVLCFSAFGARQGTSRGLRNQQCKCIVFHHVPKSGGLSVSAELDYMLGKCFSLYSKMHNVPPPEGYPCYVGHWTPAMPTKCCRMTVLRDPIQRAESALFFHGHVSSRSQISAILGDKNCNPATGCYKFEYNNDYTRFFSTLVWDHFSPEYVAENMFNVTDEDMLLAELQLQKMDLVCFLRNIDWCLEQVFDMMQIPVRSHRKIQHRNANARNVGVSTEVLSTLHAANKYDMQLFTFAAKHWKKSYGGTNHAAL